MNLDIQSLRANPQRLLTDFAELSQIGSTGDGGVHRPALMDADLQARQWFRQKIEASELEFHSDQAGNLSAFLSCGPQGAPTLLLGSHLDSVPHGGRYDGALGVVAALEALRVIQETGIKLPVNLEAVDFTDEEGTLVGFLGSGALAGSLSREKLENPKCGRAFLQERLAAAGLSLDRVLEARRPKETIAGYLELHIEQSTRLEQSGVHIGVVDRIVGICDYLLAYQGRADHSGTTSLSDRLDAGQGASGFVLAARELVLRDYPGCTVNVGQMTFEPGAFNIVPRKAHLSLEFRSSDARQMVDMEMALLKLARQQAYRFGLMLETSRLWAEEPAAMSSAAQSAVKSAASQLGLTSMSLSSGAGHDAQMMSAICPAGMIFVPSVDGASHSARELTRDKDCLNGANVLLQAALRLAGA